MIRRSLLSIVIGLAASAAHAQAPSAPRLEDQKSGVTTLLQAISIVDQRVVWVSGHGASYARTVDGGATWEAGKVPGDSTLQFRDVHAVDANTAYLLSSGTGRASRIYRTADGGKTWNLQHTNPDSAGFYDCMDFWDASTGLVYGDEVDGKVVVLTTSDGGRTWARLSSGLPEPRKNEGGFAASGTCLVARTPGHAWIGTGAGLAARVFHTADRGKTWTAVETAITHANGTSGLTSVAFRDAMNGVAVGGDVGNAEAFSDNVAITTDGGKTWTLGGRPKISGAMYGAAWAMFGTSTIIVAVGPKGANYSADGGRSWNDLETRAYWSTAFNGTVGWMVGPGGRITRVTF